MKVGITTRLFRAFVLLLFAHAAAVQSQDTMLGCLINGQWLVAMAIITGLAGLAFGYSGAVELDKHLRRVEAAPDSDASTPKV